MDSMSGFQFAVWGWCVRCFGSKVTENRKERLFRFYEEATELIQAGGLRKEEAQQVLDYVYARPSGLLHQEVGGVMVTLAALCSANSCEMDVAAGDEFNRINTLEMIERIRAKQASKRAAIKDM